MVQAIVEVLSEAAVAHGFDDVDIGGGDDTHVDFLCRRATHRNNLAILKHTQQFDLHSQRQFADFVEEDGAAIGLLKVALAVLVSPRKGAFDMTEKFTLDGALGNGTAVDADEATALTHMLAQAVLVDDAREDVLAYTALSGNENREVGRSHLDGLVQGQLQPRIVAYDVVTQFDILDVHGLDANKCLRGER